MLTGTVEVLEDSVNKELIWKEGDLCITPKVLPILITAYYGLQHIKDVTTVTSSLKHSKYVTEPYCIYFFIRMIN